MGARILLVEDNPLNRDMLTRRLARRGYAVLVAEDGAAGVAMARDAAPDLVLMDLSLPVIDGWEAARRLRADPRTRALPVIALTAHAMASDREHALAAGCDDFDTKPVELPRLLGKMEALLGRPRRLAFDAFGAADLAAVRAFVADGCRAAGLDEEAAGALVLAVDEVCSNVVAHAGGPPGPVAVTVRRAGDPAAPAAEVTVADAGPPFDPAAVADPALDAPAEDRPIGGLGWYFVRQLVDVWHYAPGAPAGAPGGPAPNVLTLVKRGPP